MIGRHNFVNLNNNSYSLNIPSAIHQSIEKSHYLTDKKSKYPFGIKKRNGKYIVFLYQNDGIANFIGKFEKEEDAIKAYVEV